MYKRQKYPVLDIERVERYRVLVGVGEINPVLAVCAVVDKLGQPQVTVTRIDQQHVRTLLVTLAHHVEMCIRDRSTMMMSPTAGTVSVSNVVSMYHEMPSISNSIFTMSFCY